MEKKKDKLDVNYRLKYTKNENYGKRGEKLREWEKKGEEGGIQPLQKIFLFTFLGPFSFSFDPFSNCLAILLGSLLRTWIFLERNSSPWQQFSFSGNFILK